MTEQEKQEVLKEALSVKPLNEFPVQTMTQDQANLFVRFNLLSKDGPVPDELLKALNSLRSFQMMSSRCLSCGLKVNPLVQGFIVDSLAQGNPGNLSMYVMAIQLYMLRNKIEEFGWDDFVNLFPNGFPSQETLSQAWDAQKTSYGNAVDILMGYKGDVDV